MGTIVLGPAALKMPGKLLSSRAKILWAGNHLETVHRLFNKFAEGNFHRIAEETDSEGNLVVRVTEVDPLPAEFGLHIGDAANNLRAALDHIAFAFAKPANQREAGQVAFPTISDPSKWEETMRRRLPGVQPEAIALFERFQPYNRGKLAGANLLAQITSLNNWDKHRALAITLTSVHVFDVEIETTGYVEILSQEHHSGRLEAGTILAKFEVGERKAGSKVQVKNNLRVHPIFDEAMPDVGGCNVLGMLLDAIVFVSDTVLPEFERLR